MTDYHILAVDGTEVDERFLSISEVIDHLAELYPNKGRTFISASTRGEEPKWAEYIIAEHTVRITTRQTSQEDENDVLEWMARRLIRKHGSGWGQLDLLPRLFTAMVNRGFIEYRISPPPAAVLCYEYRFTDAARTWAAR